MQLVLSRSVRFTLRAAELLSWLLALFLVCYSLWVGVLLHIYKPPTLSSVLEVLRYGKVTSVTHARHLPETSNDIHKKARKYAKEGLTDKAAECYRFLLRLTPDSFDCNLEYGELLLNRGELVPARKYLDRALKLKESDFFANVLMARTLFRLNRPEEALTFAQRAHAGGVTPGGETKELNMLYRKIGSYYFDRKRWDDAIALFKRADRQMKNDEIQYLLARSYVQRGRQAAGMFRKAGAYFGLSSDLDPESNRRAREHLGKCLEINPLHKGARDLKARSLR